MLVVGLFCPSTTQCVCSWTIVIFRFPFFDLFGALSVCPTLLVVAAHMGMIGVVLFFNNAYSKPQSIILADPVVPFFPSPSLSPKSQQVKQPVCMVNGEIRMMQLLIAQGGNFNLI